MTKSEPTTAREGTEAELERAHSEVTDLLRRFLKEVTVGVVPEDFRTPLRLSDEHVLAVLATSDEGEAALRRYRPAPVPSWPGEPFKTFKTFKREFIQACVTRRTILTLIRNSIATADGQNAHRSGEMLDQFYRDRLVLLKKTGKRHEDIRASVDAAKGEICLVGEQWQVDPGDTIIRPLPNGREERYIVQAATFEPEFHVFPAHYRVDVTTAQKTRAIAGGGGINVNYYGGGAQSRVNIGTSDSSVNILRDSSQGQVFEALRHEILEHVDDEQERDGLLLAVGNLEGAAGTPTFVERYKEFMAFAADHITLLAPFLPALAALL